MSSTPKERILDICTELGEDMDSPNCKALHEYIKTCPNCRAFVDSVKKTVRLYQSYESSYTEEKQARLFKALDLQ
jgi:hypothetical protein